MLRERKDAPSTGWDKTGPRLLSALILMTFVLEGVDASAGGFEYGNDNGALALSRGGASTALPALSALYTNVAGIADTERFSIYGTTNLVFRHIRFQREGFRAVADETPLFPGPMLSASVRLTDSLVLGLGFHGPAAVGWGQFDHGTADDPGPSRYLMTDMNLVFIWPTIALGFELPSLEGLRIGLGFQPSVAYATMTLYGSAMSVDNPDQDLRADADVLDPFVPAFLVGALYRVGNRVEIGFQARLSDSVVAEGEATPVERPYAEGGGDRRPSSRARLEVPVPFAVLRWGLRYRHPRAQAIGSTIDRRAPPHRTELFDVELDVIYETNSDFSEFVVTALEPLHLSLADVEIPPYAVPQHWNDTISVRLGGSVNLLGGALSLSTGISYQSAATPLGYTHLAFPAWSSVGLSLGLTYRVRWFEVTAGYTHIFMPDRTVSMEEAEIVALQALSFGEGTIVNAGHYEGSYDVLAISLAARI